MSEQEQLLGTWPLTSRQRAFVDGVRWWEWERTGATLWGSDGSKAELEAVRRYGEPSADPGIPRSTLQALIEQMRKPPRYKGSPVATSGDSYSMVEARYRTALYWANELAAILAAAPEKESV